MKTPPKSSPIDLSEVEEGTKHAIDLYRRTREVYERTTAAMGRKARYRVSLSTTTAVRIGDGKRHTS